eukprot:COSAG01_NODE_39140_length_480_cov_1.601050_1_plen_113_part_00
MLSEACSPNEVGGEVRVRVKIMGWIMIGTDEISLRFYIFAIPLSPPALVTLHANNGRFAQIVGTILTYWEHIMQGKGYRAAVKPTGDTIHVLDLVISDVPDLWFRSSGTKAC